MPSTAESRWFASRLIRQQLHAETEATISLLVEPGANTSIGIGTSTGIGTPYGAGPVDSSAPGPSTGSITGHSTRGLIHILVYTYMYIITRT